MLTKAGRAKVMIAGIRQNAQTCAHNGLILECRGEYVRTLGSSQRIIDIDQVTLKRATSPGHPTDERQGALSGTVVPTPEHIGWIRSFTWGHVQDWGTPESDTNQRPAGWHHLPCLIVSSSPMGARRVET